MSLREMLEECGAIQYGHFVLASGKESSYYVNVKKAVTRPWILKEIARQMAPRVVGKIAGVELGAVPIAVAVSLETGREYVIIRKEAKSYGTGRRIEGDIAQGEEFTIVEDVVTTGGSVVKAIGALREAGARVAKVVAVVDRQEGGREAIEAEGVEFEALITAEELLGK
jgi:orotate phosphoribosyltransferase